MATNTSTSTNPTRPADILAARPTDGVAAVGAPGHRSDLTCADVLDVADLLGIDFAMAPFSVEELQLGINVELDIGHECAPSVVDLLDDDLVELGMVAVANLQERADYYTQLTRAHAPGDPPTPRYE